MKRRILRALLAFAAILLSASSALADIAWPVLTTQGQEAMKAYVALVNADLTSLGRPLVNSLFECYPSGATLGVTAADNAELPEGVELAFTLYDQALNVLTLRVSDQSQFAALAGSCIQAASPDTTTLTDALTDPTTYMNRALQNPTDSFEDPVLALNGPAPRTYYAYYPNQYRDGVNWLQLTLVFPQAGLAEEGVAATPTAPPATEEPEYEGYNPSDGLTHFEVFTTPTPEPDSAAGDNP